MFSLFKKKLSHEQKVSIANIPLVFDARSMKRRSATKSEQDGFVIENISHIRDIFWRHWNFTTIDINKEYMVLFLSDDLKVLGLSLEFLDYTYHFPSVILSRAKRAKASKIATAHNRPHGICKPYENDIIVEQELQKIAFKEYGIKHIEHIILTPIQTKYFSFAKARLL